jgi:hypothetical protein
MFGERRGGNALVLDALVELAGVVALAALAAVALFTALRGGVFETLFDLPV